MMAFPRSFRSFSRFLQIGILLIAVFYAALFIAMVAMRLFYPYEVEFLEGAIADHSLRLMQGLPIYAKPDLSFVAFLYPPLYYYASAAVMEIAGISLFAPRLVSVLATLGSCTIIFFYVSRITNVKLNRSWLPSWYPLIGVALFVAGYGITGYFYDAARVDALFLFFLLSAIFVLSGARSSPQFAASALLFALAFLTKQQSLMFVGTAALWLLVKDRKQFAVFAVLIAAFSFGGVILFDRINDGWFSYYVFGIPSAKRVDFSWYSFLVILPDEAIKHWGLATFAIFAWMISRSKERLTFIRSAEGLSALMFLCSIIAMMMSYGNLGGYRNVTMPMVAMIAIALPISLNALASRGTMTHTMSDLLLLGQFAGLWISPKWEGTMFNSAANKAAGDRFIAELHTFPRPVLVPAHGFLAYLADKPMHFHEVSFADALLMKDEHARYLKATYDSALTARKYSVIIRDETPMSRPDSITGYSLQGRAFNEPLVFYSKLLDFGTRPQYIYVPK